MSLCIRELADWQGLGSLRIMGYQDGVDISLNPSPGSRLLAIVKDEVWLAACVSFESLLISGVSRELGRDIYISPCLSLARERAVI